MELTSSPDILRIAEDESKFFVNGMEMKFTVRTRSDGVQTCWLSVDTPADYEGGFFDESLTEWLYVRLPVGRALFYGIEELIDTIKAGNFKVW